MIGRISVVLAVLASWHYCLARPPDLTATKTAFSSAIDEQRRVLAELARILKEEKVMLSDGAVQATLEALLKNETRQADRIRTLGKQTLGKKSEELTDQDRTDRDQLANDQEVYADRYRRLEKGIESKAGSRPDSVFVALLAIAEEAELTRHLDDASELIRANQLGRALGVTNQIVATLQQMVDAVSGTSGAADTGKDNSDAVKFTAPSLLYKAPGERLIQYGWSGVQAESLALIMRSVKRMEELTERQREVARQTKIRAEKEDTADDLAKEEWEIRYYALEIATEMALLDPEVDRLIRKATGTIQQAIPGMEKGPLSDAVGPSALAADQLQAATDRLRETWKDILERLRKYTMEAQHIMGAGGGIPHGASAEAMKKTQKMIFMMLRATGALTRAMERETALIEQTRTTQADGDLTTLKPEQDSLTTFVTKEVVPFSLTSDQLPPHLQAKMSHKLEQSTELLNDAVDRMQRASTALDKQDRPDSLKRETESLELMNDALQLMINLLQHLLGQYAQQAMAALGAGGSTTFSLNPAGGAGKAGGWLFELPSEKRETVRQAFRGSFPQRFDRAIKLYYQAIAQEETTAQTP